MIYSISKYKGEFTNYKLKYWAKIWYNSLSGLKHSQMFETEQEAEKWLILKRIEDESNDI